MSSLNIDIKVYAKTFVNNKHQQLFTVGALLGAHLIIDTNMTSPSYDGGPAHVMP
jgi:hypothetical protein